MIDYMGMMLSAVKIDELRQAWASCQETDQIESDQPSWVALQIGRLLQVVGSGLTSLGKRVSHERPTAVVASLRGQE